MNSQRVKGTRVSEEARSKVVQSYHQSNLVSANSISHINMMSDLEKIDSQRSEVSDTEFKFKLNPVEIFHEKKSTN